ncbi:uncharacterized protein LOC141902651 [Tubulanus polymorphus]|uniref:uncharacterized protein LOC141902651 n=1 Tax=Tubulanus polymorphus TaxID=672921 RepID=UPI003DA61621
MEQTRRVLLHLCGAALALSLVLVDSTTAVTGNDVCSLPKKEGSCGDDLVRWYYKSSESSCVKFSYSGCGGNDNNFRSKGVCERTCSTEKDSVSKKAKSSGNGRKGKATGGGALMKKSSDLDENEEERKKRFIGGLLGGLGRRLLGGLIRRGGKKLFRSIRRGRIFRRFRRRRRIFRRFRRRIFRRKRRVFRRFRRRIIRRTRRRYYPRRIWYPRCPKYPIWKRVTCLVKYMHYRQYRRCLYPTWRG